MNVFLESKNSPLVQLYEQANSLERNFDGTSEIFLANIDFQLDSYLSLVLVYKRATHFKLEFNFLTLRYATKNSYKSIYSDVFR